MNALLKQARTIARETAAPQAAKRDRDAAFPEPAIDALARAGLLGLTVAREHGGAGEGPRAFAETAAALSEADAGLGMIFTMHVSALAVLNAAAPTSPLARQAVTDAARGQHLSTIAFSERGSRSHFWAPTSQATRSASGTRIQAQKSWVTSASHANSYVVTTRSLASKTPVETTLYLVDRAAEGVKVEGPWGGMGLRTNDSAPVALDVTVTDDARLTPEGGGFDAKLAHVLPWFCLGASAVSLGIARAALNDTIAHLKSARFEHVGNATLGESLPTLRARLASMQIDTQGLALRVDALAASLESPDAETMLRVLETKASANEVAIRVTTDAMRVCGGAAFSAHNGIERHFRDAQAGAVMAPTVDQLQEFIGRALLGLPVFG